MACRQWQYDEPRLLTGISHHLSEAAGVTVRYGGGRLTGERQTVSPRTEARLLWQHEGLGSAWRAGDGLRAAYRTWPARLLTCGGAAVSGMKLGDPTPLLENHPGPPAPENAARLRPL